MPTKTVKTHKSKVQPKVRKLKQPRYAFIRRVKGIKRPEKLPSAWWLFKSSMRHIWHHKKIFGAILLVYSMLILLLVRGFSFNNQLSIVKAALEESINGTAGQIAGSLTVFSLLVGSKGSGGSSDVTALFQTIVIIIVGLALIWTLRQTHAHEKVTLRDAFYKSMYPLVPLILVLGVILIQLVPLIVGNFIFNQIVATGVANTMLEKIMWSLVSVGLDIWSIYMICASIFAVFIVTLPDMRPVKALKSAKDLVRYRRWSVIRKTLFLPLVLFIVFFGVMLPVILFATVVAEPIFLLLTMAALIMSTSYMYSLYRELLQ